MTTEAQAPTIPESALPPGDKGAEYVADMVKKAEGEQKPADQTEQKGEEPKLLAGKFKDAAELEKAYAELQKKLGEKKPEQQADPNKKITDPNLTVEKKVDGDAQAETAQEAVEKAGLDWDGLNTKWASNGALEDADYEALEKKAGIPKHIVDQFIDGRVAAAKIMRSEVTGTVGGEEKYGELMAWAGENLSAEEVASFNKIAKGADVGAIKIAVSGLKARYDADGGSEPNLIGGDASSGSVGYKSHAEMKADMAKPEYAKDPEFRSKVMAKLRATTAF